MISTGRFLPDPYIIVGRGKTYQMHAGVEMRRIVFQHTHTNTRPTCVQDANYARHISFVTWEGIRARNITKKKQEKNRNDRLTQGSERCPRSRSSPDPAETQPAP